MTETDESHRTLRSGELTPVGRIRTASTRAPWTEAHNRSDAAAISPAPSRRP